MIEFGTTLVITIGRQRNEIARQLKQLMDKDRYIILASTLECDQEELLEGLKVFDSVTALSDIIFVATDEESSRTFLSYKYDEKVALRLTRDPREFHAPSGCWVYESELPSLIERLERNISDHANF